MWTPNTTARAEGASKAKVTQFKVALTKFKAADSIAVGKQKDPMTNFFCSKALRNTAH